MNGKEGFLELFEAVMSFYKQYLDNILGIWLKHPNLAVAAQIWQGFKDSSNDFHGLKWVFTEPTKSDIIFMDMSLLIQRGKITSIIDNPR